MTTHVRPSAQSPPTRAPRSDVLVREDFIHLIGMVRAPESP